MGELTMVIEGGIMKRIILLIVLGLIAGVSSTFAQTATRLYVKTTPDGARVFVDGQKVGTSNDLFELQPGTHNLRLERDGFKTVNQQVDLVAGQITRLEVAFEPVPPLANEAHGDSQIVDHLVIDLVKKTPFAQSVLDTVSTVVKEHPGEWNWSGETADKLFAIVVREIPADPWAANATPALLQFVHSKCVAHLIMTKALLDYYSHAGLTETDSLQEAVESVASDVTVVGTIRGVDHVESVQEKWVVGLAVANPNSVKADLANPETLEKVKVAYRKVVHAKARTLMVAGKWEDALVLWRHLHQQKLVSEGLYVDAALCFSKLGQNDEAAQVLQESLQAFADTGSTEFFERVGDLALEIGTPEAQRLAQVAYDAASKRLLNVTTTRQSPNE